MPIYEYECTRCGRVEEVMQQFSDKRLKTCRKCSGKLHKLISRSSFHLKGTGWYVTDYAGNTGSTPDAKSDGKKKTATGTSSDSSPPKKTSKTDS